LSVDQALVVVGLVLSALLGTGGLVQSWRKDSRDRTAQDKTRDEQARLAIGTAIQTAQAPIWRELDQHREDIREIREDLHNLGGQRETTT
jgi:hypothetical protein